MKKRKKEKNILNRDIRNDSKFVSILIPFILMREFQQSVARYFHRKNRSKVDFLKFCASRYDRCSTGITRI